MASNQYSFLNIPQTYSKDAEDTLFTITLDDLDVGLLPLNKLLDKYNGDQSKPIWDLGTNKKTLKEYSDVADQYVKLQVSAEPVNKADEPQKVVETQYCQLCCISIPIIYTRHHLECAMHRRQSEMVSYMLEKAKRQMQKPLSLGSDTPPKHWSYCTACNVVLDEHSQFDHSTTDKHKLSVKKEQLLSRLVALFTNREEKPPVKAEQSATVEPSTSKTIGKESFPTKKVNTCQKEAAAPKPFPFKTNDVFQKDVTTLKPSKANTAKTETSKTTIERMHSMKQYDSCHMEVTAVNGDIVTVLSDNWHGIVRFVSDNCFECKLCDRRISLTTLIDHLESKEHKKREAIPIMDRHANRKIVRHNSDPWYHCVLCNVSHYCLDIHIQKVDHTANLQKASSESRHHKATSKQYVNKETNTPKLAQNCENPLEAILKTFDTDLYVPLRRDKVIKVSTMNWHDLFVLDNIYGRVFCRACMKGVRFNLADLINHINEDNHTELIKSKMDQMKEYFQPPQPYKCEKIKIGDVTECEKTLREVLNFMTADRDTVLFVLDMEREVVVPSSYGDRFLVTNQNYHGIVMQVDNEYGCRESRYSCLVCGYFSFYGGVNTVKEHIQSAEHLKNLKLPVDFSGYRKIYVHTYNCITCNSTVVRTYKDEHLTSEQHLQYRQKHDVNLRKNWNYVFQQEYQRSDRHFKTIIIGFLFATAAYIFF